VGDVIGHRPEGGSALLQQRLLALELRMERELDQLTSGLGDIAQQQAIQAQGLEALAAQLSSSVSSVSALVQQQQRQLEQWPGGAGERLMSDPPPPPVRAFPEARLCLRLAQVRVCVET
jgi:hypothetical protein